jgi:hypothetical protein
MKGRVAKRCAYRIHTADGVRLVMSGKFPPYCDNELVHRFGESDHMSGPSKR